MEMQKIQVVVNGLADIMFDRFMDHSKEKRPPEQKLYLTEGNVLVLPAENIYAFLFSENPAGCAKWFEGKKGKSYISIGQGHVLIDPFFIPFTDGKKPIVFKDFTSDKFWIHQGAPRTKQGSLSIKQEIKPRPVLKLPWQLAFDITLIKNALIDDTKLYNWFVTGGLQIGFGTYRPRFGRFDIAQWEIK